MDRRMRDYMAMRGMRGRDGRNPYGSRGGYVVSSRSDRGEDYARSGRNDRRMMDRRMMDQRMDRGMDYGHGGYYEGEFRGRTGDHRMDYGEDYRMDYGDYRRDYADHNDYYGDMGDYGGGYLSPDELRHWEKKLMQGMEKGEKDMMSREKILKRAEDMGIKFEEFTPDELVVATLMMYTDYCSTIGKASLDMYIKLAKDFLCDEDAGVQYGEKLAAYYDHIANV